MAIENMYIGGAAAFADDRLDVGIPVANALIASGKPAALFYENLAERTLALAHRELREDPLKGYTPDLAGFVSPVLRRCVENGVPVIGNFGAANPMGAAMRLHELAKELGTLDTAAAKRDKKEFDHLVKKYNIKEEMIKQTKKQKDLDGDVYKQMSLQQDKARELGNTIQSAIESIPVLGGTFSKALGLENLGERMSEAFDAEDIKGAFATILTGQASFNKLSAKNVWGAILAAILATAAALRF